MYPIVKDPYDENCHKTITLHYNLNLHCCDVQARYGPEYINGSIFKLICPVVFTYVRQYFRPFQDTYHTQEVLSSFNYNYTLKFTYNNNY